MKGLERTDMTTPEHQPDTHAYSRFAPNEGNFPLDAALQVVTDDGHVMTFAALPKGPQQKEFLLSLLDSQPPITSHAPDPKEIYVEGDRIIQGQEFRLASHYPSFSKTAFRAMRLFITDDTQTQ